MSNETSRELTPSDIENMPEAERPWWFTEAEDDGFAHGQFIIDQLCDRFGLELPDQAKDMIWHSSMGTGREIACQTYNAIHHPESCHPKDPE